MSSLSSIRARGSAPRVLSANCPFLKYSSVGILVIPNFIGVCRLWSTFNFPKTMSLLSFASCSIMGVNILQGPHQAAQQSNTTTSLLAMKSSKVLSVTSTG